MELPLSIRPQKETMPKDLLIYGVQKLGKSEIIAGLTKQMKASSLVISLEKGGYDYLSGNIFDCYPKDETSWEEAFGRYKEVMTAIKEKRPYQHLIIDTTTALDEWSKIAGTYQYMNSTQGKMFNCKKDEKGDYVRHNGQVVRLTHNDIDWKYVTEQGEGYGYRWTRDWFMKQIREIQLAAPYRIYVAHIKDKYVGKTGEDFVTTHEINLTGQLKNIMAAEVTSIAKLVADGNKRYLSFQVDDSAILGGSRSALRGEILISELIDGQVVTYWENIYPDLIQPLNETK